jgi:hypothetical protein
LKNFAKIKNEICFRLVNRETNCKVLKAHPHIEVLDLAVLFYYKDSGSSNEEMITIICHKFMKQWQVSVDELYELAKENTEKLLPPVFQTIEQVMGGIADEENLLFTSEEEPQERMYVMTNRDKYFGAGCCLYPGLLEEVYHKLKVEFFVLPSSIHEIIIMPDVGGVSADNLQSLVIEMNQQFLLDDEVLSNHVYRYNSKSKALSLALGL